VVDALERIHTALAEGGVAVDTQPISPWPPVVGKRGQIALLDMSEWAKTIAQVDAEITKTIERGLFEVVADRRIVVPDHYDDVAELVQYTSEWEGTSVPPEIKALAATEVGPVELRQDVRVRLLAAR
jgi:hypothetical protein